MAEQESSPGRGWFIVIVALAINLVLGVLYSWSVLGKALATQRHWSSQQASLPFMISTIAFAVTMIFAGRLQDKRGPRVAAMLGGVMLGAGLILSAYAPALAACCKISEVLLVSAAYGVIGGIGIGLGYSATTPPCVKWFPPSRKGLIAGLVVAGVGLSAVYMAPLTTWLLGATSAFPKTAFTPDPIGNTFLVLGIGTIVIVMILSTMLKNPPAGYVPPASAAPTSAAKAKAISGRDMGPGKMLETGQFWMLWMTFVLAGAPGLMLISQVAKIAKDQANWDKGYLAVMLLAVFNTCGRVVGGVVSDRLGRTQTMVLAFVIQAANMFVFRYYTSPELLVFGACLSGLCYGTIFTLMPMATADFYGLKNLGMNYGLLFTAFGVAGSVGPFVAAKIRDNTGSFSTAYPWLACMVLVGAVLAFITRAPKAAETAAAA